MTTIQTNRRRRLIVNPALQSRIIVNISWPPAVALAVSALLFGLFSTSLLDEAFIAKVELPSLVPVLVTMIGFLIVSLGFLVFQALKLSHRIAGPMYRLQKTLEAAKAGDYTVRANLREHDYLVQVADSLNEFLDVLDRQQVDEAPAPTLSRTETSIDDAPGPQGLGERSEGSQPATAPTTDDPTAN